MLSILIPIYNYDCRRLVRSLHQQALRLSAPFELIAFDDGSTSFREENNSISRLSHTIYRELPHNLGRSAIRNALAEAASYEWLLFMDCDSQVIDDSYLQNYLKFATTPGIICGGRYFSPEEDSDPLFRLHWLYGTTREPKPGEGTGRMFLSNNFMISRTLFLNIRFDERIRRYGHEDTLFGLELEKRNIPVRYIHNPLLHEGLETNAEFIMKTEEGMQNLAYIYKNLLSPEDAVRVKMIRVYEKIRTTGTLPIFRAVSGCLKKQMKRNLLGNHPRLYWLDIYRLLLFCRYLRDEK